MSRDYQISVLKTILSRNLCIYVTHVTLGHLPVLFYNKRK